MFSQLGPVEVCCDAPPYPVVQACQGLSLQTPLDVRWCRLSHFLREHGDKEPASANRLWNWLWWRSQPKTTCNCGEPLPHLQRYPLADFAESVGHLLLGQCRRYRTILWEIRITHCE
jgi:hypothetical protein